MRSMTLMTAVAGITPQEVADIKARQQAAGQAAKQNANDAVDQALQGNFAEAVEHASAFTTNFLSALFILPVMDVGRGYNGQKIGMGRAALQLAKACAGPLKGHAVVDVVSPGFLTLAGNLLNAAEHLVVAFESGRQRVQQATDPLYNQTGAQINDAYTLIDPGLRLDPLMATTMQEVTKFVEERVDRAVKTRKEHEAIHEQATAAAEAALGAKARDAAREEAKKTLTDKLEAAVKG